MSARAVLTALALAVLPGLARPAGAQTCTAQPGAPCTISTSSLMTVPRVVELLLDAPTTITPAPTDADYEIGYVSATGPTLTVRSNAPWTVAISAGAATWLGAGLYARLDKPAGDLLWALGPSATYAPLSTAGASLGAGSPTAGSAQSLFYRVVSTFAVDTPGTYSLDVVLTLAAP